MAWELCTPRDLPNGQMLTQCPTTNNTQKCHVNHSKIPCCQQPWGRCHMGQFSMKITPLPGSLLGANQHTHVQAGPAPPLKAPRSRRIAFSGFLRDVELLLNDRANDLDAVFPSFGRFTPPQAASAGIDSREMVQFHHPMLGAVLDRLLAIGGIKPPFGIPYLTSITCRNPGPCAPRT